MNAHCSADPACPYPVTAEGICRHHQQFYAYSESLIGSSLDRDDYLTDESNVHPLLSVVLGTGEPWLKWIPPSVQDRSYSSGNFADYLEGVREQRKKLLEQIKLALSENPGASTRAIALRLGISKSHASACFQMLHIKNEQRRFIVAIQKEKQRRLAAMSVLLANDPNIKGAEIHKLLTEQYGIKASLYTVYCDLREMGRGRKPSHSSPVAARIYAAVQKVDSAIGASVTAVKRHLQKSDRANSQMEAL